MQLIESLLFSKGDMMLSLLIQAHLREGSCLSSVEKFVYP